MDRITVIGIRAWGHHGVFADERRHGQPFVVDVELGVEAPRVERVDELSQTLDYAVVARAVASVVEGEPVKLIETLAARIADRCMADVRVSEVTVTVHKPEAPIGVEFADVSVSVTRRRP